MTKSGWAWLSSLFPSSTLQKDCLCTKLLYTRDRNVYPGSKTTQENQGNRQNFNQSFLPEKLLHFHGDEAKLKKTRSKVLRS